MIKENKFDLFFLLNCRKWVHCITLSFLLLLEFRFQCFSTNIIKLFIPYVISFYSISNKCYVDRLSFRFWSFTCIWFSLNRFSVLMRWHFMTNFKRIIHTCCETCRREVIKDIPVVSPMWDAAVVISEKEMEIRYSKKKALGFRQKWINVIAKYKRFALNHI